MRVERGSLLFVTTKKRRCHVVGNRAIYHIMIMIQYTGVEVGLKIHIFIHANKHPYARERSVGRMGSYKLSPYISYVPYVLQYCVTRYKKLERDTRRNRRIPSMGNIAWSFLVTLSCE